MPTLNTFFTTNLFLILVLLLVWLLVLSFLIFQFFSFFKKLTHGVSSLDLKSLLEEHLKNLKETSQRVANLEKRCDDIEKDGQAHLQKVGLVRFNPFKDAGGDQSFALAVLNEEDDGVVVSSLHGRDQTRIYAKPVKESKGTKYELSKEEGEAITRAQKHVGKT